MSVEVDYIQMMRNALTNFRVWEETLEEFCPLIKDGCAHTALRVVLGGLNTTITWLNHCILCENEAQREKKNKEEGGERRNFWIITVAEPWCDLLLGCLKTLELRKRVPNLKVGDIIFVCRKGDGTAIVGAFRLMGVCYYSLLCLCQSEKVLQHWLSADEVKKYANGSSHLFGLRLSLIPFDESIKVEDFGYTRNPQGFYRIRTDFWHNIPEVIMRGEGGER